MTTDSKIDIEKSKEKWMDNLNKQAVAGLIMAFIISLGLIGVIHSQLKITRVKVTEINKQADTARAGELAGLSQLLDMNDGTKMIQSGLLAVEAAKYGPSLQADQALRRYLNLAALPIAKVSHGLNSNVYVAFSSDGKYVVSGGRDSMKVWESQNGHVVTNMPFYAIGSVAISPDGKYVAAGAFTENGNARMWEVSSGREVISQSFGVWVGSVTFSPDGKYVAWSGEGTIRVWDVKRAQEVVQMPHQSVYFITFSPDGKYLLSSGADRTARIWDVKNGSEVLQLAHNGSVKKAIFSPDGKYIASASDDHAARVWDANSGRQVSEMYHDDTVYDIAFSPDGRYAVSGSGDGTARVWEALNGHEIARVTRKSGVGSVAFSPNGEYIVSTEANGGVARAWVAMSGHEVARFADARVNSVVFSPDGKYVATGGCERIYYGREYVCEGVARVWELSNGRQVFDIPQKDGLNSITYSSDGKYVLTSSNKSVRTWELQKGMTIASFALDGNGYAPLTTKFSPNGKYILTKAGDNTIHLWDVLSGYEISHMTHTGYVTSIAFSPDSKYVISGGIDGIGIVWEAKSGREVFRLVQNSEFRDAIFSPDGQYIVSLDEKNLMMHVWEAVSGNELTTIAYRSAITTMAFSPNSQYIAFGTYDGRSGTVYLFDAVTGHEIINFTHPTYVSSVIFTSDGKYLISGSDDTRGTIVIWEIQSNHEVARILNGDNVRSLMLNPDNRYLLVSGATTRVWDLQSDKKAIEVRNEITPDLSISISRHYIQSKKEISKFAFSAASTSKFSPDGRYILTTGCDFNQYNVCNERHVFILNWRIEDLIVEACRRLPRNFTQEEWVQYFPDKEYRATCPNLPVEP